MTLKIKCATNEDWNGKWDCMETLKAMHEIGIADGGWIGYILGNVFDDALDEEVCSFLQSRSSCVRRLDVQIGKHRVSFEIDR